jgi:hypothetical protein
MWLFELVGLPSSIARCRKVMARKSVEAAKLELSLVGRRCLGRRNKVF